MPFTRALIALLVILALGVLFQRGRHLFPVGTRTATCCATFPASVILACGMTTVIIAGGIDLSVGSVLGSPRSSPQN
jgi:ribose transport system permease protein